MESVLAAQTGLIEEYVTRQEELLIVYSKTPAVRELLKDVNNKDKLNYAQTYTEDSLKDLQDAMTSRNGVYDAGIIVSPASGKLILSMYCPVFDTDGKTILGYVGGGPLVENLEIILNKLRGEKETAGYYMVNAENGMYIFADDESLIATEIQDDMLLNVVEQIKAGKTTGEVKYKNKQGAQVADFQYITEHGWAVVSFDSERNIYGTTNKNMRVLGEICIVFVLVISILAFVMIYFSIRPLHYVEQSIIELSNLKLQKNEKLTPWIGRKSEVGKIATAMNSLYMTMGDIVNTLSNCSNSLNDTAAQMEDSSDVLISCISDNSQTTTTFQSMQKRLIVRWKM